MLVSLHPKSQQYSVKTMTLLVTEVCSKGAAQCNAMSTCESCLHFEKRPSRCMQGTGRTWLVRDDEADLRRNTRP